MGNWICKRKVKERRILIQGLDAAGKTSMLYRLRLGEVITTIPTIGFNVETIDVAGYNITCWDVGGRDKIRPLFRHYYPNTDGFIYVIDSSDRERLSDAFDELTRYVLQEELTFNTVVMVLANKQDIPGALTVEEIEEKLKEQYTFSPSAASKHTVLVRSCSVLTGEGLSEAIQDFVELLSLKDAGEAEVGLLPLISADPARLKVKDECKSEAQGQKESLAIAGMKAFFKDPFSYVKSLLY